MNQFFKRFLQALLIVVGVFSGEADAQCAGTLYFKPPSHWNAVYFNTANQTVQIPFSSMNADGWWVYDLSNGHAYAQETMFALSDGTKAPLQYVTTTAWDALSRYNSNAAKNASDIPCPGEGNTVYVQEDPFNPGNTYIGERPASAKYLYVLVPDDKDWIYDNIMVSTDGGVTGTKMEVAPGMCGWYRMVWEEAPDDVLVYPENHPDQIIGLNGLWGEPTSLPLKTILEAYGSDQLYFIPDDTQWFDSGDGFYVNDPGVDGVCEYALAGVIWDSDQSVNTFFGSDPGFPSDYSCIGVHYGIVKTDLGGNGKPVFNEDNENAEKCAGDSSVFNALFNYRAGVNEAACYDMAFTKQTDGRWAFDSDELVYNGYKGGFYPRENLSGLDVDVSLSPHECTECRTKRAARGAVPYSYDGDFEKYCNTIGWSGGIDCEGLFNNGDNPSVWDWGATSWDNSDRNQQFCYESHSTFVYHEDQEFSIVGSDDIWVFVNNKLAIDNGGAHLPVPGYVVLKNLNTVYGTDFLIDGRDYPLDIFFCDRISGKSDIKIKTNIFVKQGLHGLSTSATKNSDGSESYSICYGRSDDGSCASVAFGSGNSNPFAVHACGSDIGQYGALRYKIATRSGVEVATLTSGQMGWQYGGIDLSDPFNPKVNKDKIIGLAPGSYRLVIDFYDKNGSVDPKARTYINFRINGNLDVMTRTSTYTANAGDEMSLYYPSGTKWTFVDKELVGRRVPVYVSAFADGGVDLLGAIGQRYTLYLSKGLEAYDSPTGDVRVTWPRVIGQTGVDTVYIMKSLSSMTDKIGSGMVKLKSMAAIDFYAPQLVFAKALDNYHWSYPVTADPDDVDGNLYYHWVGSDVNLKMLVIDPIRETICNDCTISLAQHQASSGIQFVSMSDFVNGVADVVIHSSKEYMDDASAISVAASDDPNLVTQVSYGNLHFRKTPVPYPQLVDLFDTRGRTLGPLYIDPQYYSEHVDYLDGRADSIAIYYSRPFNPDSKGSYADSLPNLICLDWDEEDYVRYNFYNEGLSNQLVDTLVRCSYVFSKEDIIAAHESRVSDSILTFAVKDTAFSKLVKTAGNGKILSFAQQKDKGQIVKLHYDRNVTDRIAPVILSARVDDYNEITEFLTVRFSEPVQLTGESYKNSPFAFYLNSTIELSESQRYALPVAQNAFGLFYPDELKLAYNKSYASLNPVPRAGDYIRFRSDSWMWRDAANIAVDGVERDADDYYWHWNSPTDYNSLSRLPSPWVRIEQGDVYSSSSQGSQGVSSASTQSSSSMKQSSSSVKQSSSSTNSQGGECTLTDMGDGRIIQKCGNQETVLYKALCGTKPYDPDGDYFCYGVKLYEKCDGEAYDVNTQECVGGTVKDLGSSSSGKEGPEAIKAAPQVSWSVQTKGRTIHIFEAKVGSAYALIDMQGRVLNSGVVNSNNFTIPVGLGGQYMLKIGNQSQIVRVW